MITRLSDIKGLKVTVMGLGLHGGGAAAARFFASHGADVTITDLRDEETLSESLESLRDLSLRNVLGRHEERDFSESDLVIKNPAVPTDSPYLAAAQSVETDISLFLRLSRRPLIAVTGSKGKSTTASALAYALRGPYPDTKLGGNITVSPLTFLESCLEEKKDPVVLELSSRQLGDLPDPSLLRPSVSIVTNILPDHQDAYPDIETYAADKKLIFSSQTPDQATITFFDDPYGRRFAVTTPATPYFFSSQPFASVFDGAFLQDGRGYLRIGGKEEQCLPDRIALPGAHNKLNLCAGAVALRLYGLSAEEISSSLASFPGIEHRLELVRTLRGVMWYNDSSATIPEATVSAVESFDGPVHLIIGGTDKNLDFEVFRRAASRPASCHLLAGSATDKLIPHLDELGIAYHGPFSSLSEAVESAGRAAEGNVPETVESAERAAETPSDAGEDPAERAARPSSIVLFSPASASFELFLNEFDRGRRFKKIVQGLE